MFKRTPPPVPKPPPPDELRRRALDLVLAEARYQPALRVRCFFSGFAVGVVLMAGIDYGHERALSLMGEPPGRQTIAE